MADSPATSPPAPETPETPEIPSNGTSPPSVGTSPPNESSPPTPASPSPPTPNTAPPPDNNSSSSSPPPAPPAQEASPPPPATTSPPAVTNPPPQTPVNPSPPAPQGPSPPGTPPAPPQTPTNQSPPSQARPNPPSPGASEDRNRTNGGNNNRGGITPSPPSGNRGSSDSGSPSPPRSISPPRNSGDSPSSSSGEAHQPNIGLIIGVLVGAGLLLLLLVLICVCCNRKKKKKSPQVNHMHYYNNNPYGGAPSGNGGYYNNGGKQEHVVNMTPQGGGNWGPPQPVSGPHSDSSAGVTPAPAATLGHNQSTFTYQELSLATQGFSESNLLGQGGFGYVHKGVLPSGKEVAVKSLKLGSGQGEREFQAEVEIISRVHHRHLVSLVGYCISGGQRLLVYEFLPNNTLEFHLHGKGRPVMEWSSRVKIAIGSARGLAYLHEDCHPKIIHRDIKAANILLDFSFETKVADFGLAKLSQDNYTHVSTRVMGTFGYLAPEYASSGKLSDKSDVFSFGVMLLELITGKPPVDLTGEMEDSLVDWARPLCLKAAQDGDYRQLADPRLEANYDQQEMARMASCAAAAIRHSARRRPKMSQIVRALEADISMEDLSEGTRPGHTHLSPGSGSSEYDASSYSADIKKFRKLALESKEYQSSEYGMTSEYGLNPSASSSEEMHRGSMKGNTQF